MPNKLKILIGLIIYLLSIKVSLFQFEILKTIQLNKTKILCPDFDSCLPPALNREAQVTVKLNKIIILYLILYINIYEQRDLNSYNI